jgi:CDP-Glycerol:Poly(glycerophosphate) glycerophosphotransferase
LKRPVAVAFYPHHVEHLAPVCAMLGAPLVVCDSAGQERAVASYPRLEPVVVRNFAMPEGIRRVQRALRELDADVIFCSDLIARRTLRAYFRDWPAKPRVVHVPHGFSEKMQRWSRDIAFQDIALMLGRHAIDQLRAMGVTAAECTMVVAGNLRRAWYAQNRAFFTARRIAWGLPDDPRRTILYAPTWDDRIGSTSFFSAFTTLLEGVPRGSRLVVKLHPHLEQKAPQVTALCARAAGRDDVIVLRNCPLVLPILDVADVYIGDMSAMAYDYLGFDRPMFFLNQVANSARDPLYSRLFRCGATIGPADYAAIYATVEAGLADDRARFSAERAALDAYTHAPALDARALRDVLERLTAGAPPAWLAS